MKFPNVTVCPPKGSNTALNYDLTRLRDTFQDSEKIKIAKETKEIFTGSERRKYVNGLLQAVNPENLRNIYQGDQTIPNHVNKTGLKIELTGATGQISTPPAAGDYPIMLYVFNFPKNLDYMVGRTGELIIELVMESNQTSFVHYKEGPMYEFFPHKLTWQAAENYCNERGGHLASVTSDLEMGAVFSTVATTDDLYLINVWLGAGKNETTGKWAWIDGNEWVYDDWYEWNAFEIYDNCLMSHLDAYTFEGTWRSDNCDTSNEFICEFHPDEIVTGSKIFTYDRHDLPAQPLHLWWKSEPLDSQKEREWGNGLILKWRVENKYPDVELASSQLIGYVETPGFKGMYEEELYKADRRAKFTLKLADKLGEIPENSTLIVKVHTEMGSGDGWEEKVLYTTGSTFNYHSERKNWKDAEQVCVGNGGHLASVRNDAEFEELRGLDLAGERSVWLGGTINSEGDWSWIDGHKWNFSCWDSTEYDKYPQYEDRYTKLTLYKSTVWRNLSPMARLHFICRTSGETITGVDERVYEYNARDRGKGCKIPMA